MIERRLKKTHKTVILALHARAQELQREMAELNAAIGGQVAEWAPAYGLDPEQKYSVTGKDDGELYLVLAAQPGAPAGAPEVDLSIPAAELAEAAANQAAIEGEDAQTEDEGDA